MNAWSGRFPLVANVAKIGKYLKKLVKKLVSVTTYNLATCLSTLFPSPLLTNSRRLSSRVPRGKIDWQSNLLPSVCAALLRYLSTCPSPNLSIHPFIRLLLLTNP
uniref:Uncharacterized protein n=1 Tax=Cyclopterus lumpus TaxID=8103 RepID=A0A8C2WNM3_CYCLU